MQKKKGDTFKDDKSFRNVLWRQKKKKTEALIKYYLNKKSVSSSGCRSAELCGCVSISSSTVVDWVKLS